MFNNEERKNNFNIQKNREKIRRIYTSQVSSEFRSIMRNDEENTNVAKNNFINHNMDKKQIFQFNINNISIYNVKEQKVELEKKNKKVSISVHRKGSKFGTLKQNENDNIEEDQEDELNFRQRITIFFDTHNRLFYIQLITSILSILSCSYYILCTYIYILFKSLNFIDFVVCAFFLFEHIINILLSPHFITYIISIESLLNFFIEIPPFFSLLCSDFYLNGWYRFINVTRVFRLIKGFRIIEMLHKGEKSVNYQIFNIIGILLEMILIWAGVIHMLDLSIVENDLKITFGKFQRRSLLLRRKFHHYIYFTIVSLTTVGYGEIIPLSILGKFMIVCLVIVILVVIPEQTSELINLSNAQSIYERKKYLSSPDISFVILLGDIELETLKSFIKEYFNKTQGVPFRHIVILKNKLPDKVMEVFLNKEENAKFITYLQGDPMNDNDLLRCDILNAKSCIIFTNKDCIDPHSSDHRSLLLSIFIKKFYYHLVVENYFAHNNILITDNSMKKVSNLFNNKHFRIFLQLNKPENSTHYFCTLQSTYKKNMLKDKLLVIESFKLNLLSKSCMTPGIISLISNFVITSPYKLDFFKNEQEWLREYAEGQQYEIFKVFIEGNFLNYTFQRLALEIYIKFHSLLIALEIGYKNNSIIKLNPISNETINDVIISSFGFFNRDKTNIDNIDIDDASLSFLEEGKNNELEIEYFSNYNNKEKKEEIDRKKIKIFLFLICDGKETKNDIIQLDRQKNLLKKKKKSREITSNNILETLPLNIFNKKKKTKKSYTKSNKSEFYDNPISYYSSENESEEEIFDKTKFLVNPDNEGGIFLDMDELSKNYYITNDNEKNNCFSNEIMKIGIKERNDIKNHVIICGMHNEIIHLILPLRAKYIPEKAVKWIVILANYLPHDIHDIISNFPKIIFIQGDPLKPEFLHKANISSADIAVILNSSIYNEIYTEHNNEMIGKEEEDLNGIHSNLKQDNKSNKLDGDAKTLFIYKSIKKLNKNIQIITDLLQSHNIEFLHTSKELKKLYNYSKVEKLYKEKNKTNFQVINDDNNNNNNENINYEYTPVYAAGEIFLPSLIDKITGQMYHKEYLYNILNLLLKGEQEPPKSSNKKLTQLFNNLINSNLFLIPCDSRNESFGDMFQRLLIKNKMISIALYRKNMSENFYYVYTNPKKTTLIRETDLVFVLSSTDSILNLIEKNLLNLESLNENNKITSLEEIEKKTSINGGKNLLKELHEQIDKMSNKKVLNNNSKEKRKRGSFINDNPLFRSNHDREILINKGKYIEIDKLQKLLDKGMEKLKEINKKVNDTSTYINNYIKEGINDEFCVYLNKKNIYNV